MSELEGDYLLGIHDFRGRSEDEMSLRKGDHIQVIETDKEFNDGWYIGRNLRTQQAGLFPKVFTTELILSSGQLDALRQQYAHTQQVPPQVMQKSPTAHSASVHETLTDIDAAISELTSSGSGVHNQNAFQNQILVEEEENEHEHGQDVTNFKPDTPSLDRIKSWTPDDVQQYFISRGYDMSISNQFLIHKITGPILLELDLAYLKEIDISSFGTRFEISKEIKYLNSVVTNGVQRSRMPSNVGINSTSPVVKQSPTTQSSLQPSLLKKSSEDMVSPLNNRSPPKNSPSHHRREPSFNRNWVHPSTATVSNSMKYRSRDGSVDSGFVSSSPQTPVDPLDTYRRDSSISSSNSVSTNGASAASDIAETTLLPESSHQHKRSGSRSSYVQGLRERHQGHNRVTSRDTLRNESAEGFYRQPKHTHSSSSIAMDSSSMTHQRMNSDKSHRRHSSIMSFDGGLSSPKSPGGLISSIFGSTSPSKADQMYLGSESNGSESSNFQLPKRSSGKDGKEKRVGTDPNSSNSSSTTISSPQRTATNASDSMIKATQKFVRRPLTKQKTSAFLEGIQQTTAEASAKTASYSGWMYKRGGVGVGTWKSRYFTLHGTRLSYFGNLSDQKEKGLIDINSHRVLPARANEDKFVSIYAASVGAGKHCFKLVPPAPGSRKGVTFTAPKVHYFAVESKDEMRSWMAALMKATIDRDESVPVISSCATPTVPLAKAQELFAEARAKEEDLRMQMITSGLNNRRKSAENQNSAHSNNGSNYDLVPIPSTPESPTGSSLKSSETESSLTNNGSLKAAGTSPNEYGLAPMDFNNKNSADVRHMTTKTAGLKIVTDLGDE